MTSKTTELVIVLVLVILTAFLVGQVLEPTRRKFTGTRNAQPSGFTVR